MLAKPMNKQFNIKRLLGWHIFLVGLCLSNTVTAQSQTYTVDKAQSTATFVYELKGANQTGSIPIKNGTIELDIASQTVTSATIVLVAEDAQTPKRLFTRALKSAIILDTNTYPDILFTTGSTVNTASGQLTGTLNLKSLSRSETVTVQIKSTATAPHVTLRGSIDRFDYGIDGLPKLLGQTFDLTATLVLKTTN